MATLYINIYHKKALKQYEKDKIESLIKEYINSYKYKKIGEVLTLSESKMVDGYLLCGSIKLPYDISISSDGILEIQIDALDYWLQCLNTLYRFGWNFEWKVTLDDISLTWDTRIGWKFERE